MMSARTYLVQAALTTVILTLSVLGFTWVIDPYGITGAPRMERINYYKVDINDHARLMKKYAPGYGTFDTLILGNSRVEMGIDPKHDCFARAGMSVYNLGLPGATLRMQFEYALNTLYQQPVERIFLSLDFSDFVRRKSIVDPGVPFRYEREGELQFLPDGSDNPEYASARFMDFYRSMFSMDALADSVLTLVGQDEYAPNRDERGFNPARDYEALVRLEGPRALFDQKIAELRHMYSGALHLCNTEEGRNCDFDDLESFLDIVAEQDVQVVIFTNPFHSHYWELLEETGQLELYTQWTLQLRELVVRRADSEVALWEFSSDSPYIQEMVPASGEMSGPLRWFWEPAHYRRQLGDLMVDAMLAESCATEPVFGHRLQ